jgi:hypothetical protein
VQRKSELQLHPDFIVIIAPAQKLCQHRHFIHYDVDISPEGGLCGR